MPLLAYIDPGSGSMLLQVLLAGVLAIPFFFRRVIGDAWHRIRGGSTTTDDASSSTSREETDSRG
jgi:hypothetical protein